MLNITPPWLRVIVVKNMAGIVNEILKLVTAIAFAKEVKWKSYDPANTNLQCVLTNTLQFLKIYTQLFVWEIPSLPYGNHAQDFCKKTWTNELQTRDGLGQSQLNNFL